MHIALEWILCFMARKSSELAVVAGSGVCPSCAVGAQVWREIETEHFGAHLAIALVPFIAIAVLCFVLERRNEE